MTRNHFFALLLLVPLGLSVPACRFPDGPSSGSGKEIEPSPEEEITPNDDENDDQKQSEEAPAMEEDSGNPPPPDTSMLPDTDMTPVTRGNMTHGQACTNDLSCQEGMRCLKNSGQSTFLCFQTCESQTSLACGAGTGGCCNKRLDDPAGVSTLVCNLHYACDPIGKTSGCAAGSSCYFLPCEGDLGNVTCSKTGKGDIGQTCQWNNDCAPGLNCIGTTCKRTCRLNATKENGGCMTGICIPRRFHMIDSTTYGYCPER